MSQKLCLIHANCQGDTLQYLLKSTPSFAETYTIKKFTNYLQEDIDDDSLEHCHLFLYQHLNANWGELATENLLQKLPSSAQAIQIPNMFFNGYWPLWTNQTFMAYGDMLLEELCQRDLAPAEILHIYTRGKVNAKYDLDTLRQQSLNKEMAKETNLTIKTLDFIQKNWKKGQLFYTINHPAPILSLYVADKLLALLQLEPVPQHARKALLEHEEEFIQPIHPQIGELYGLSFANEQRQYPVYGQYMDFKTYSAAYIQCRLQKGEDAITDFVVYLHLLAEKAKETCVK